MILKMKIRKLILLGLIVLGVPAAGMAQFDYITNNGAITIDGYTGTSGNAVIPATINGLPVTTISGFFWNSSFTNITIPASVTNIASGTFSYDWQLISISVDAQNSFYSSTNGVLFDKAQSALIQAPGAISGNYVIPDTVTSIGDSAFGDCFNLSDVILPNGVTNIGVDAFENC